MIPTKLEEWNYDIIKELSENYMEGDTFDFKCAVRSRDPSENNNVIRTTCSFANTKGGFIIFGVCRTSDGHYEIKGLERYDNYAKEFGDKIQSANPTIYFEPSPFINIPNNDKVLLVMHIPQSYERPHMTGNGVFYYRTNKGNDTMNYEQVREAFLRYDERRYKLQLLFSEIITNKTIAEDILIKDDRKHEQIPLTQFEPDVMINLLPEIYNIIGNDKELMRALLQLRMLMNSTNSRNRLIQSVAISALSNRKEHIMKHNLEVEMLVNNHILPIITQLIEILKHRYNLKHPLAD